MPGGQVRGKITAKRVPGENQRITPAAVVSFRGNTGFAKMKVKKEWALKV